MLGRWKLVSVGLGGAVLVLAGAWLWSENWFQPRTTQAEVRGLIETQLPLGSTVEQANAFLDGQGWLEHSGPHPNQGASSSDGFEQQDPDGSTLLASIPDAYPGFIVSGGISLKFGFDAHGALTRYQLEDAYTGP